MKQRGANIFSSLDWPIMLLYTALIFMGWFNIYAACYDDTHQSIFDFSMRYGKQLVWIGVAYVIIVLILVSDYKIYTVLPYIIYGGLIVLLLLVLVVGTKTNGARSWFEIGPLKIQPAEFAKFATALALSKIMSEYGYKIELSAKGIADFLKAMGIILLPCALIILQPDMGSILVYFSMIFVFYRAGLPGFFLCLVVMGVLVFVYTLTSPLVWVVAGIMLISGFWYLFLGRRSIVEVLIGWGAMAAMSGLIWLVNHFLLSDRLEMVYVLVLSCALLLIPTVIYSYINRNWLATFVMLGVIGFIIMMFSVNFVFNDIMTDHQQTLIRVFLGLENDPQGTGYNVEQSKIAIGSGGFWGKGYLQGTQTKFNFVPEQATDFIFCTVGEEWGFVGSSVVIIMFVALLWRIIYLAELQKSMFAKVYGYCVASILFFHLAINVGMTIGLVPVIGIPLPFFSYGGSSLWSFTILLFIFVRMDASRDELL